MRVNCCKMKKSVFGALFLWKNISNVQWLEWVALGIFSIQFHDFLCSSSRRTMMLILFKLLVRCLSMTKDCDSKCFDWGIRNGGGCGVEMNGEWGREDVVVAAMVWEMKWCLTKNQVFRHLPNEKEFLLFRHVIDADFS